MTVIILLSNKMLYTNKTRILSGQKQV